MHKKTETGFEVSAAVSGQSASNTTYIKDDIQFAVIYQ